MSRGGSGDIYSLMVEKHVYDQPEMPEYRVVGGVAAQAIIQADAVDWGGRTIELASDTYLSSRRANGTLRDVDMVVVSTDEIDIRETRDRMDSLLGDDLEISVFGLRQKISSKKPRRPNFDCVSHRLKDESGQYYIEIDDIVTPLPSNWYDPWTVYSHDGQPVFTTVSPVAIEAGYKMRSISGVRPRDVAKLGTLREKLATMPQSVDDQSYYEAQYSAGLAHQLAIKRRASSLGWFGLRAAVVGLLEQSPALITCAQRAPELVISRAVGSR